MFLLIYVDQANKNNAFFFALLTIYLSGFFIELAGVKTELIFGKYAYGSTLGIKLWDIPLLIGINWVLLVFGVSSALSYVPFGSKYFKVSIGAIVMVLLDRLIEPVAVKFDYWSWQSGRIPLQNYLAWFVISWLMLFVIFRFKFEKRNATAAVLLLVQFLFFAILNKWAF
nr:carotenoid biosynthesis protein [Hufsiella arboris]